jgi:hypothetical protein
MEILVETSVDVITKFNPAIMDETSSYVDMNQIRLIENDFVKLSIQNRRP